MEKFPGSGGNGEEPSLFLAEVDTILQTTTGTSRNSLVSKCTYGGYMIFFLLFFFFLLHLLSCKMVYLNL